MTLCQTCQEESFQTAHEQTPVRLHSLAPERTRQRLFNGSLEAHVVAPLKSIRPVPRQEIGEALLLLQTRTESFWTLSWLTHGCPAKNGRSVCGCYHGCHMDALQKTDGVYLDVIMVATWMHCKTGRSLCGTLTWLPHGCSAKTDGVFVDVIMAATWMLSGKERSDNDESLRKHRNTTKKTANHP